MKYNYIFLFIILFIFSCSDVFDGEAIYGCTDKDACNYNKDATNNWEGSCEYPIGTCDCDNSPIDQYCNCDGDIDSDFDGLCDNIDICLGEYDNGTLIFCKGLPLESNRLILTLLKIVPKAITVLRIVL